jgi:hypothetical protein
MPHTVSRRPLTAEPGFNHQASQYGIYGGQNGIKTCFLRISLFPVSPVSVIQPVRQAYSSVYHRQYSQKSTVSLNNILKNFVPIPCLLYPVPPNTKLRP